MLTGIAFGFILLAQGTTTTTTLGPQCGNLIVEAGEACDPPYSREPGQCPAAPGKLEPMACQVDCTCPSGVPAP